MKFFSIIGTVLALLLVGCSKPDPTIILGTWRAESFKLDSLNLPIAPNFEVTRNEMILKLPDGTSIQRLQLASITADKQSIALEFKDGMGVSIEFDVVTKDRIHFRVPLLGFPITYNRI